MALAYEVIRLAGRYDNPVTRVISAPGLWLQRLTTNEPDDAMIEVAIAAIQPVLPEDPGEAKWYQKVRRPPRNSASRLPPLPEPTAAGRHRRGRL